MNQATETDLQIVELGDAKEVTMGPPVPQRHEDNPLVIGQYE